MSEAVERLAAIKAGLDVGAISYDGDSWYAASSDGGAGIGYDECERRIKVAYETINNPALAEAIELGLRLLNDADPLLADVLREVDLLDDEWPADIAAQRHRAAFRKAVGRG